MQAGGVATRDVYSVSGRVLVNGVDIGADVKSVSVARDIPEGLPGASAAFQAATADVVAVFGGLVTRRAPHPWEAASVLPKPGDKVEIWLSDGTNEWRQIVGELESPAGTSGDREVFFTVIDRYPMMRRTVNIPALSSAMPSLSDASDYRYVSLRSTFLVDSILRQSGRFCTPPMTGSQCFVSVTMQGSTWPERGECVTSIKQTPDESGQAYPNWRDAPYGVMMHNLNATYSPWSWSGLDLTFNRTMEITQEIVPMDAGSSFLRIKVGMGHVAIAQAVGTVRARYYPSTGGSVDIVSRAKGAAVRVSARFTRRGPVLEAELRFREADGSLSTILTGSAAINAGDLDGVVTNVWASGDGAQGAFQAGYPTTAWSSLGFISNAVINADVAANSLTGVPPQINVDATSLLQQIAEAELASWWIDENDVLQWWDRGGFRTRRPVATLTGADHVKEIPWEYTSDALRHEVHVDYQEPIVTHKWRTDLTLWEGGSETYNQGDTDEIIVKAPSDEIWLGVDYQNPTRYSAATPNYWVINRGIRSVIGGIAINAFGEERLTNSVIPFLRRVDDNTFAFGVQVTALSTDEQAALQFPQDVATDTALYSRWRGKSLPILRGKKKIKFQDKRVTATTVGPASAPNYEHEVGWLIQNEGYAQGTANYIAGLANVPQPVIPSLDIMPVFNLQVGDVITMNDPAVTGISIRAIVIGNTINADFETGEASQALRLRPLSVELNGATWTDFGAAKNGSHWQAWATSRSGDTWTSFGTNPLK